MSPHHAFAVLLLVSSTSGAAPLAPSFREQVETCARSRSLTVDWVVDAQLDEDAKREHMARLCTPRGAVGDGPPLPKRHHLHPGTG